MIGATTLHGLLGGKDSESLGYGYLYNWHTVDGNSANLITNLHVPSDAEWTTLTTYLGGLSAAGGLLKKTGISYWNSPNTGAVDSFNFTALPGGYRRNTGIFSSINSNGMWGSITESNSLEIWRRDMYYSSSVVARLDISKAWGISARCMRSLTAQEQIDYSNGDIVESKADYDGNVYNVVRIGTQGWTNTNLKCTNYLTGTAIPNVTSATTWAGLTTGARCAYDNDESNV